MFGRSLIVMFMSKVIVRHKPKRSPAADKERHFATHLKISVLLRKQMLILSLLSARHSGAAIPTGSVFAVFAPICAQYQITAVDYHSVLSPKTASSRRALLAFFYVKSVVPLAPIQAVSVEIILKSQFHLRYIQFKRLFFRTPSDTK